MSKIVNFSEFQVASYIVCVAFKVIHFFKKFLEPSYSCQQKILTFRPKQKKKKTVKLVTKSKCKDAPKRSHKVTFRN